MYDYVNNLITMLCVQNHGTTFEVSRVRRNLFMTIQKYQHKAIFLSLTVDVDVFRRALDVMTELSTEKIEDKH